MTIKLKAEDKKPKEGEGDDGENPFDSVRSRLKQMSEGDDANAKAAKRALDALEKGEEPEAAAPEEEPAAAAAPAAAASSGELTIGEVHAIALAAEARAAKLEAKLAKRDDDAERETLIAQHPSLPKTMVALLRKSSLALVRETLKDFEPEVPAAITPKPGKGGATAQQARAALQAGAKPTRGKHSQTGGGRVPVSGVAADSDEYTPEQIDKMMGMSSKLPKSGNVRNTAHKLMLGGPDTDDDDDEGNDEADAALRAEAEAAGAAH